MAGARPPRGGSLMTGSDPVIQALLAAIAAADSAPLRKALAEHRMKVGDSARALLDFEAGLALAPADVELIEGAAAAAKLCGDEGKARAYELAAKALSGAPSPVPAANPPAEASNLRPLRVVAAPADAPKAK